MFCISLLVECLAPWLSASVAFSDSLREVWYLKKHLSKTTTPTFTDIWNSKMRRKHLIRKTYSANPHLLSFSHTSTPSDFESLFTNLRWGCPQLMWQEVTNGIDEGVRSLTLKGFKFLQVYSGLKSLLPVILEKKLCMQSSKYIRNLGHSF